MVNDFASGEEAGDDGMGEDETDRGGLEALCGGECIVWGATWAGEGASQPLQKNKPATATAAATESMEREDGEFMPSPTNPIP